MPYAELLLDPRWISRRRSVIIRDHHRCNNCHNIQLLRDTRLAISDQFFRRDRPWQRVGHRIPDREIVLVNFHRELFPLLAHPMMYYYHPIDESHTRFMAVRHLVLREWDNYEYYHHNKSEEYLRTQPDKNLDQVVADLTEILKLPFPNLHYDEQDYQQFEWLHVAELNVHHTYYQLGRLPWEYPEESLQTYCQPCHMQLHRDERIPVRNEEGNIISDLTPCTRCAGAGEFPEFRHIEEGICFRCHGAKYEELIET